MSNEDPRLTLPTGIELPGRIESPSEPGSHVPYDNLGVEDEEINEDEEQDSIQGAPAVAAVLYTRDSKKLAFAPGQWEMDQYGVSGKTSATTATIVPHANVSRIVMVFDESDAE